MTSLSPRPSADDKLRDIQSLTDAALSHLDAQDLLVELLDRAKEILQADTAAVLLLDRGSGQLIATAASGLEEEVSQGVRIPVGGGFAGRIAAERRPIILDRVDHTRVLNPILLTRGDPVPGGRAADSQRHGHRRPAAGLAHPPDLHQRRR